MEVIVKALLDHPQGKKKIKKRPLLQEMDKARELYEERLPLYRKTADVEIAVEGLDADEIADRIIKKLKLVPEKKPE